MSKLTVCGGGNAAHVLIGLGASSGWEVDVFAPLADEAERLRQGMTRKEGIVVRAGEKTVLGLARQVSADPADVIPGSQLVLLALPAFAHGVTMQAIVEYLDPNVILGALPARGGFDFQALTILGQTGTPARLFGMQTLPWACRIVAFGEEAEILGTKATTDLAAYPSAEAAGLAKQLGSLFHLNLTTVSSFLTLTLGNTGQLIHPGIMYGLGRDKVGATFSQDNIPLFYQGVDDATADILQAMSDEVQAVAKAVANQLPEFDSQEVIALSEWVTRSYAADIADRSTLRRAFNTNRAYDGLRIPSRSVGPDSFVIDFKARYLAEDVPYGLVVLRGIAELVNISTPMIDEVIIWAQAHLEQRYLEDGTLSGPDLTHTRAPQVYGIQTLAQLADPVSN